jgi:hypothetical protein
MSHVRAGINDAISIIGDQLQSQRYQRGLCNSFESYSGSLHRYRYTVFILQMRLKDPYHNSSWSRRSCIPISQSRDGEWGSKRIQLVSAAVMSPIYMEYVLSIPFRSPEYQTSRSSGARLGIHGTSSPRKHSVHFSEFGHLQNRCALTRPSRKYT